MKKPNPGLRTQLVLGLALILVVATVSVGGITTWATRSQVSEGQLANARMLGSTLARVLAAGLEEHPRQAAWLNQVATGVAAGTLVRRVEIVDREARLLASSQRATGARLADPVTRLALQTEQQTIKVLEPGAADDRDGARRLVVATPIFARGRLAGAVRLEAPFGTEHLGWPSLFWALMGIDGLLMVVFVGFVLTRYVIRPIRAMQRAALRVTEGDLSTALAEDQGARELSSLAGSFNTMTASVREQLGRLERQREELAASREQVIRAEKLASVGRLAAGVAHEVGNPLQAIMGFTDLLLQGKLPPAEQRDFLARIDRETQRINRIIRELLDYARPVDDALEPVSLAAVVEQARQLVGPQRRLREGVSIEVGELSALPAVAANTQRLVQVLVNLLLNAADAMAGSGVITIEGSAAGEPRPVELRVSNDGPPIPAADRGRIFDPFFTTKDPGEGTGLGLCVAQSIVESYGGRLTLAAPQADDGAATCFVISLHPWRPQGAAQAADAPTSGQTSSAAGDARTDGA